jgi:post-segregation antitoxin (ccd killing protein)
MTVDRLSVTVDPTIAREVRQAASDLGVSVSSWVAEAIEARLRNQRLREALDTWEAEDGPLSEEELGAADRLFVEAEAKIKPKVSGRLGS